MLFSVTMGKMHAKMPKYALDIFIGSPTGLLKSLNFQCRLPIQTFVTLYFYFEQIQSADLTLRPGCFRVAKISFYIEYFTVCLSTLQKTVLTVIKKLSHNLNTSRCISQILAETQVKKMRP